MAESVVSFVVERLGDLLIQEGKFLFGVGDQIKDIQKELTRMQCFLRDADARQDQGDERVRNWVAEIRDLAYRTEDVLESYALKVASKKEGKRGIKKFMRRFACIFNEGVSLHKIGSEIKTINTDINNLTTSLENYGIKSISQEESSSASDKQRWQRMSYPDLIEQDFVGMEDDVAQLVLHVVGSDKECNIVSIKGMGGQGKTTVATKIYNRAVVRSNFKGFAWTCVTQQCEPKKIFQDILRELVPEIKGEVKTMGDRELVQELRKVQQEKRCLVVLDDIWSIDDWESLKSAFPIGGAAGSKIILTTRIDEVAKVGYVHGLRFLVENEGWELLQKKAFPKTNATLDFQVDREKEKIGRDMVKKCAGLPLAISVLGGILKGKSSSTDWETVNKDINSYLRKGEGIEEDHGAVTQVLGLSYNDLPYRLKSCFMHLGNFKEDSRIDTYKLYLLWMAEGLLSSDDKRGGETMTDVAERYLGELAQRSMVQVELVNDSFWSISTGRFSSCRLHDLMRDLCLSKAKKEDFLKIVDSRSHGNDFAAFMTSSTSKTRRLAIHSGEDQDSDVYIPDEKNQATRNLRSLMLFGQSKFGYSLISGIKEFKFLRVLDFGGWAMFGENGLLEGISKLIHLRYLSFGEWYEMKELPESMGDLQYLQVLDFKSFRGEYEIVIPNVLWKMKRLRHLYLPFQYRIKDGQKLRLDGLIELETLFNFDTRFCEVKDLEKSRNLRLLDANVKGEIEDQIVSDNEQTQRNLKMVASISRYLNPAPSQLRKSGLSIRKCNFDSEEGISILGELFRCMALHYLVIVGPIVKLPECHHQHLSSSLTIISLIDSEMEEDPMATLEKLPSLRGLALFANSYVGREMVCSARGFSQLRYLHLFNLPNLEKWHVDKGAMPNLFSLEIFDCKKLEMVPEGFRFLSGLKEINFIAMKDDFLDRVRVVDGKEGEDFYKVRHVPSIKFNWWD